MNCFVTGGVRRGEGEQNECFCNNLDLVYLIWIKFGMDIQLDPRKKPAEEFLIFLKIQDGQRRLKVQNRSNLTPQTTFRSAFGSGSSDLDNIWHWYTN